MISVSASMSYIASFPSPMSWSMSVKSLNVSFTFWIICSFVSSREISALFMPSLAFL